MAYYNGNVNAREKTAAKFGWMGINNYLCKKNGVL